MNIYKILEALKSVEEAGYPFAGNKVGQKPGDQVRGKEAFKTGGKEHPAKGRLVGASESVETECNTPMTLADKLRARWEQTKQEKGLQEYGMTTGGTAMTGGTANPASSSTNDPAAQAREFAKTQEKVNTLKSAGVPVPSTQDAVKAVLKDPTEPATPKDRQVAGGLGQEVEQLLAKGDPGTVNQLASLIRKVKGA